MTLYKQVEKFRFFQWGGALLAFLIISGLILSFIRYTQDDVFITYTYSRNLVEGYGFVFNPGEQVQGTTTPLWTIMMAFVYMLTPNLLTAGNLLSGTLFIVAVILSWKFVDGVVAPITKVVLALVLGTSYLFYVSLGMETLLYCALLMGALLLWKLERRYLALVLAGLLVLVRFDGAVLAAVLGLILLSEAVIQRTASAWRTFFAGALIGFVVVAPWFIFALLYFGSLTPNTFSAKSSILGGLTFLTEGWDLLIAIYSNNPLSILLIPAFVVGMFVTLKRPDVRPLPLWIIAYTTGYTILNTTEFWYYTPLVMSLLIVSVIGADALFRTLFKRLPASDALKRGLQVTVAVGMTAVFVVTGITQSLRLSEPPYRTIMYRQFGEWLDLSTPSDSTLMLVDLGIVGYYARRHAVDSYGLIVPEMYNKTPIYTALKYRPDYAVTTNYPPWFETLNNRRFHRIYRPIFQIPVPEDPEFSPSGIYERRLPLVTPLQVVQGEQFGTNCTIRQPAKTQLPQRVNANVSMTDGTVIKARSQGLMFGAYPDGSGNALGDEVINEQIMFQTGALPAGSYTWAMDCGTELTDGTLEVLPLSAAPDYQSVDTAEWTDGARLTGLWLASGETLYTGGTLRLMLEWELMPDIDEFWIGVEMFDTEGQKQAEGIFLMPEDLEVPLDADRLVSYGEVNLPVLIPEGLYRIEINRFSTDTSMRVPLAGDDAADVFTLPIEVMIQRWQAP